MESNLIDNGSFAPDSEYPSEILRTYKTSHDSKTIDQLCKEAQKIARPKFLYKVSFIEEGGVISL